MAGAASGCALGAYYKYTDEDGVLHYEHVRCGCSRKEFAFRRPDPSSRSGWRWSLGDCQRVLYRLPELVRAPEGAVVFVTEGESDADALSAAEETATTSDAGALTGTAPSGGAPSGPRPCVARTSWSLPTATSLAASPGTSRRAWKASPGSCGLWRRAGKDVRDHLAAGLAVTDLVWWS